MIRDNTKSPHGKLRRRRPRLSPLVSVGVVAVSVMLLMFFGGSFLNFFADRLYPNITFGQGRAPTNRQRQSDNKIVESAVFDGEVYRTEGRLREASAVAIAAALSGIASISEHRPAQDVSGLLNDINKRGLLPPSVSFIADHNLLASQHSIIYVRLRPAPFAVEILSVGRERMDGPAMLLRVPDERQNANAPTRYFYSLTLEKIRIPDPFTPPSAILACGWQTATIKPELTVDTNSEQLAAWANTLKQR